MSDVAGVIADEQAKASQLQSEGKLGAIYLATLSRGTVFIVTYANSVDEAESIVGSLPMAKWWNIDVYPLSAPGRAALS